VAVTTTRRALLAIVPLLALAGCGSSAAPDAVDEPAQHATLTVFAASSLKNPFTAIGAGFEKSHPGVTVRFSFAGSPDLAEQINAGAPADVFAAADEATMRKVPAALDPEPFATNILEIAIPDGNPAKVETFADLARPGLKLVICAAEVPCGAATESVAHLAGVTLNPVSREQAVVDVLGKVRSGEADAGLVYVTDVKGSKGAVDGISFPEAKRVVNVYPIATLKGSEHADLADEFVASVRNGAGHAVLVAAGFGTP
jgi:molybdate transport system substrate-binding protein